MLLTGLTMGFSLMGLKWVDNIVVFYVLFGALGALTMIGGAEMLTVAIVPKWFVRKRGRAVAFASTGTAMGPLFFPFLVHGIITLVGCARRLDGPRHRVYGHHGATGADGALAA